jgi:hypothetical protein
LRVDIVADFICSLLNHMESIHARKIEVGFRDEDKGMDILPWIDADNFNPTYLMRDLDRLPRRGSNPEWQHNQDYWSEREAIPAIDPAASEFIYDGVRSSAQQTLEAAE